MQVGVVPVVLLANVFLGIYYNVSKLVPADRQDPVCILLLIGVGLTILFNIHWCQGLARWVQPGLCWFVILVWRPLRHWWGWNTIPTPFELTKILLAINFGGILIYYLSNVLNDRFHTFLLTKFILNTVPVHSVSNRFSMAYGQVGFRNEK